MYNRSEIEIIFKNCKTVHEVLNACRVFKFIHNEHGQPLYNVQYLSLMRIKKL